jgi:glycerol-3-phosphate acyltransferase PlsY
VASLAASFTLPFATWFTTGQDVGLTAVTGGVAVLAFYRHRHNIQRLLDGTEHRIQFRKRETAK